MNSDIFDAILLTDKKRIKMTYSYNRTVGSSFGAADCSVMARIVSGIKSGAAAYVLTLCHVSILTLASKRRRSSWAEMSQPRDRSVGRSDAVIRNTRRRLRSQLQFVVAVTVTTAVACVRRLRQQSKQLRYVSRMPRVGLPLTSSFHSSTR